MGDQGPPMHTNLLLTGARGAGKSTVISRALALLPEARLGGYVTERIGPRGQPQGSMVAGGAAATQPPGHLLRDLSGATAVIAHRDLPAGKRFGPYRVDLDAFETVGVAALASARRSADLIVADEIGRMEEGARAFAGELMACLDSDRPFLGVLSDRGGELVEGILQRRDIRVIEVTEASRDLLPRAIAVALQWECLDAEAVGLPDATGAILAGGQGSRLTREKGWLELGGVAIVERVFGAIRPLVGDVVVVGDPAVAERLGAGWAADEISDVGPLAGIAGGLRAAPAPVTLVAAWDMPFLSPALGAHMLTLAERHDAVAPHAAGRSEPLFAAYRDTCLEPARAILAAGGRRPQELLEAVNTRWVEGPELAVFGDPELLFFSVNTPADLERARAMAGSHPNPRER
jgi:molybdopterin-guanine dinucleotide biosynthesis protein A